jgi:hypothetical protein
MGITDATTSLTATWTEQATVTFNSGTLSSITDCVTEVESKLQRGTLSASSSPTSTQVQQWLIRAKQELAETKGYTWKRRYASVSTVAGTYKYALPPDFNGGRVALKDTTNDRYITLWDAFYFDAKFPDPSEEDNDEPTVGCVKNFELWLAAPPNGVYTLELEYDRSGADNTTTDFSWLPEIERFRCCDYAIAESFESLHMFNIADRYMQKWNMGIGKARRADGKRRWKSMNFQAISFEQEYALKNYQSSND